MGDLFGGVETGGTWCVCALGRGPGDIIAHQRFPTGEPGPTLERIAAFFAAHPAPEAIGIGSFGLLSLGLQYKFSRHYAMELRVSHLTSSDVTSTTLQAQFPF